MLAHELEIVFSSEYNLDMAEEQAAQLILNPGLQPNLVHYLEQEKNFRAKYNNLLSQTIGDPKVIEEQDNFDFQRTCKEREPLLTLGILEQALKSKDITAERAYIYGINALATKGKKGKVLEVLGFRLLRRAEKDQNASDELKRKAVYATLRFYSERAHPPKGRKGAKLRQEFHGHHFVTTAHLGPQSKHQL